MVYGVHAAGDGCLCVLGAVNNSKAEKQRENQPSTGFLYFSLLAFHHLILRRDLDNETEISRDDHY